MTLGNRVSKDRFAKYNKRQMLTAVALTLVLALVATTVMATMSMMGASSVTSIDNKGRYVGTQDYSQVLSRVQESRTAKNIDNQLNDIEAIYSKVYMDLYQSFGDSALGVELLDIRQLVDFASNIYWIVEFAPHGYSIYDSTFEIAVELNKDAISPWNGLVGQLVYGGATHYYIKPYKQPRSGILYQHVVLGDELHVSLDDNAGLIEQSNEMSNNLDNALQQNISLPTSRGTTKQSTKIADQNKILKANTNGFNTNGNCGYVSSALLVWYAKERANAGDSKYKWGKQPCKERFGKRTSRRNTRFYAWT
jgi:hypothetical protein